MEHSRFDPENYPKNFIVWLDKFIGQPNECVLLKTQLFMALDPTSGLFERTLNSDDINNSIAFNTAILVQLDNVKFLFQAFVDVEKCFNMIEKNIDKRVIVITSGSKGRMLVPSLVANFPNAFGKHNYIYIFAAILIMQQTEGAPAPTNTWVLDFLEQTLMFNHQDDLFARMIHNLAVEFCQEGSVLQEKQEFDLAIQRYEWSKQMYERFELLEPTISRTKEIKEIVEFIDNVKKLRDPSSSDNDDCQLGTQDD